MKIFMSYYSVLAAIYYFLKKAEAECLQHANICIKEKGREGERKKERRIRSTCTYMSAGVYWSPFQRSHEKKLLLFLWKGNVWPGGQG